MSDTQKTVEIILEAFDKLSEKHIDAAEYLVEALATASRAMKATGDYIYCHDAILRAVLGLEPEENP